MRFTVLFYRKFNIPIVNKLFVKLSTPPKLISCFVLLLGLLCFAKPTSAQYFELLKERKRVTLPFKMVRNMVIIQLNINDKGPFNFILDTGVGIMIITDPTLIDSIGIQNRRIIKLFGLGEQESLEAYVTSQLKIDMPPGLRSGNISAAILKKDQFGLSNYAGMPIHGLLGYDFFNSLAVKFNFFDSTLVVSKPENLRLFRKGYRVPITIEDHKPYLKAKIKLPGGKEIETKLVIDIGAGHPVSLENMLKENGLPQKFIRGNLGIGLTGPIKGFLSRIDEISIGKFTLKDVITSFPEVDQATKDYISVPRDGNLGLGILKRFQLIIDYPENAIYLKKGVAYEEPFEHDMSGMEYFADKGHVFINRIEPGSSADIMGVQKDDEIVAINFKSVADLSLEQIDSLFRSKNDRSLLLEIFRNNKYLSYIITLKRRI